MLERTCPTRPTVNPLETTALINALKDENEENIFSKSLAIKNIKFILDKKIIKNKIFIKNKILNIVTDD